MNYKRLALGPRLVALVLLIVMLCQSVAAQSVNLKVYDLAGAADTGIAPFAEQFEESNPNVDVDIVRIPHESFYDRLVIVVQSPSPPDIVRFQADTYLVPFVEAGLLLPLDTCLTSAENIDVDDWFNPELVTLNDQVMGVPFESQGRAIVYNKSVYDELGLSIPTTWDELLENVAATTRDLDGNGSTDQFGWVDSIVNDAWVKSQFGNFMVMNGADLVDESLERATVTDEEFVQALEFYTTLNKEYGVPNPNSVSAQQMAAAIGDGTAVHAVMGSWWPVSYADLWGEDFEYGVDWAFFPNPAGPSLQATGQATASFFGTWAWGISARSENPEAACELLDEIAAPQAIATYNTGMPTSRAEYSASSRWEGQFYQDFISGVMEGGVARSAYRGFDGAVQAARFVTDAVHTAILTDRDVEDIAAKLQQQIEGLLD